MEANQIMIRLIALAVCLAWMGIDSQAQPSAAEALLGKAMHQEDVEGNCDAAIKTYRQVLSRHASHRAVAAKAQLRIGACQERLGDAEARRAYERVVANYTEQKEAVAEATARLAAILKTQPRSISVRQIWSGAGTDNTGTVNAAGRYLSYVHWQTGDLAVRDLLTGQNRMLTNKGTWEQSNEFADMSVMSSDGKHIVYSWENGKRDPEWAGELRVLSTAGGAPRALYSIAGDYASPRAWSPDGRMILAAVQKMDTTNELTLIPAAGGAPSVVLTLGKGVQYRGKAEFSRDGRWVIYDRAGDIFAIPAGGGAETALVQHPAADGLLGVTADGAGLLFSSNRTGSMGIWLQRMANGKPQGEPSLLKPDVGPVRALGVTANGGLFYSLRFEPRDVYQASLDIGAGTVLEQPRMVPSRAQGTNSAPDWSREGTLVFRSDRSVFVREAGAQTSREVVPQLRGFGGLHWSADGQWLLAPGNKDGVRGLYKIDVRTGDTTQVMPGGTDAPIGVARWSPDEKSVFYRVGGELLHRELATGATRTICRSASDGLLRSFAVSPDGKQAACVTPQTLVVVSVGDGQQRTLLQLSGAAEAFQFNGALAWSGDGRHLVFAKTSRFPRFDLWKIPAAGGAAEKFDLGMDLMQEIRLHPDGKRIAFSAGSRRVEVWALENFLK